MPVSKHITRRTVERILRDKSPEEAIALLQSRNPEQFPLPPALPREASWTKEDQEMRLTKLKEMGMEFEYISGERQIDNPEIFEGNIEAYIGTAQLPIGVIGPLRINGINANGDFFIPLATTEGALVASYNRGAKVISRSGGVRVLLLTEGVSRAPVFMFDSLIDVGQFLIWSTDKFEEFKRIADTKTNHGVLDDMLTTVEGNSVFLNFQYTTGDASGQNIVTIATEAICEYIAENSPVKPKTWFIESNMSGDKKATEMSYIYVRGKKVTAELTIEKELMQRMLHTTPEQFARYAEIGTIGAVQAGSIGAQGHYANALAALFIACGQDAACVSEASIGITRVNLTDKGDLYISITLPNLIVGTVGGGTGLPTQRECLRMIGCEGDGASRKFAEMAAATIMAGEISIMGALASGEFAAAHQKYGRRK